jgi:hypothetical protein
MAIAGARMNDNNVLITNLKKAIQMDSSLRKQAENDREFIKFFENDDFKGLVNSLLFDFIVKRLIYEPFFLYIMMKLKKIYLLTLIFNIM